MSSLVIKLQSRLPIVLCNLFIRLFIRLCVTRWCCSSVFLAGVACRCVAWQSLVCRLSSPSSVSVWWFSGRACMFVWITPGDITRCLHSLEFQCWLLSSSSSGHISITQTIWSNRSDLMFSNSKVSQEDLFSTYLLRCNSWLTVKRQTKRVDCVPAD